MTRDYRVQRGVEVPLRDGVRTVVDIYRPDGDGRWPVLLTRTPYGRGDVFQTQFILNMQFADAISAGFAVVVQDIRGRGESTGAFTPFVDEEHDAEDTLDWIAAQDFSDGRVAMFGASYVGATQWLAAVSHHPALVSIAPLLTAPDFRDQWVHPGGAFHLAFQLQWLFEALGEQDIAHRQWSDPALRESAIETLRTLQADPSAAFARAPLADDALATLAPYLMRWLRQPEEFPWERLDLVRRMPALPIPALHVIGWNDLFGAGGLRAFERASEPDAPAAHRQYLVAGPWSHGNMSDWQGDRWYGYGSSAGAVGIQQMQLELATAVMDGREPNLPRVQYFTSGVDEWRSSEVWPLPDVHYEHWALSADGTLVPPGHPTVDGDASFRSDPDDPVPAVGGPSFLPGILQGRNSAQKVQTDVEDRDDVVLFTSPPVSEDVHIIGEGAAKIWGFCDQPSADWIVRLCDVSPDGTSFGITDGILRVDERDQRGVRTVTLAPTSHVFLPGHRLRVQVAGSSFPRFDLNPHTGMPPAEASVSDRSVATQTIRMESGARSVLLLPVAQATVSSSTPTTASAIASAPK